jgi:hypothetical protein
LAFPIRIEVHMLRRVLPSVLLVLGAGVSATPAVIETIQFFGFLEGDVVRDQYMFRGLRIAPDDRGGPFYDDAGSFAFLMDTPPGVLNLNPLTEGSGPGRVHASVGTYVFDVVDPSNPYVPSYTDRAEVSVVLVDKGRTVLTALGADGEVLATDVLEVDIFQWESARLSVSVPGIQRFTLTTPLESPTIGTVVDTVALETPAVLPSQTISIDVRPGSRRNLIRPGAVGTVPVAILSEPGFNPSELDPALVLFQQASPVSFTWFDRNHDRVRDLVLEFRQADLQGLTVESTRAMLTAVSPDGTSLKGEDDVVVEIRRPFGPPTAPVTIASGSDGSQRVMQEAP